MAPYCAVYSDRQTVSLGLDSQKLNTIVVRHNLQGTVEILYDEKSARGFVEITRHGSSEEILKLINVRHQIYHLEEPHRAVFVLEVSAHHDSTNFALLYGCLGAIFVLLVIVIIAVCVAYEWRHLSSNDSTIPAPPPPSSSTQPPSSHQVAAPSSNTDDGLLRESPGMTVIADTECVCERSRGAGGLVGHGSLGGGGGPSSRTGGMGRRQSGSLIGRKVTLLLVSLMAFVSAAVFGVCEIEEAVDVVFHVPSTVHLDPVDLFFNIKHRNEVFMRSLEKPNGTRIKIYDLNEMVASDLKPCDPGDVVCSEELTRQGLSGCDAATLSCVCQRGYTMVNGLCVDLDECQDGLYRCPFGATCNNTNGSYVCSCPDCHYLSQDGKCSACSTSCPPEHFEKFPCSAKSDRICQECTECVGATYESRPCTDSTNRKCIYAVYPFIVEKNVTLQLSDMFSVPFRRNVHRKRLRVESHSKLIMENLHNNRDLETTYYVTDSKQMTDFYWFRESGIRVNVGLESINLVPVYADVSHSSDNDFISQNPGNTEEGRLLADVISSHCRHPIADYYSLTLEIAKDRATKASLVSCTQDMFSLGNCPEGVFPREGFINRSLNDPCQEMGSFPENLPSASNSIVCTESSALLRDLFNVTPSDVRIVTFPSKVCKQASLACEQCLEQDHCTVVNEATDDKCCQIDCLATVECKLAMSRECTDIPVQCAMGDAYRFTLQPVFASLKTEFRCHLRRKKPDFLYQLWFDIIIPGTDIHSPRYKTTICAGKSSTGTSCNAQYQKEFLSVEHNLGIEPEEELILVGHGANGQWNHSVYSARTRPDAGAKRIVPHMMMLGNAFVVSVQFARPFSYSTSTWVKERGCHKDIQVFRPAAARSQKSDGVQTQPVKVTTLYSAKEHYEYRIKSLQKQPQIKLIIPANISILSWWFRNSSAALVVTDVQPLTSLTLSRDERLWQINISGMMSDCPGYISVTINDFIEQEELFNYDLIVPCPQDFQVTFSIPTWGVRQDKTFELILFDAKKTFRIFLTHFWRDPGISYRSKEFREAKLENTRNLFPSFTLLVLLLVIGIYCVLRVYVEMTKKMRDSLPVNFHDSIPIPPDKPVGKHPTAKPVGHWLHSAYAILVIARILYAFLFTFTTFSVVMRLCLPNCTDSILIFRRCQDFYADQPLYMSAAAEDYYRTETSRQAKLARSAWKACDVYMSELLEMLLLKIQNIRKAEVLENLVFSGISFTTVFGNALNATLSVYRDRLRDLHQEYQRSAEKRLQPKMKHYGEYADVLYGSPWLVFPQVLFDLSLQSEDSTTPEDLIRVSTAGKLRERAAFVEFISAHRVESARHLYSFLRKRYDEIFQSLTFTGINFTTCLTSNSTRQHVLLPFHMNTTRFIPVLSDHRARSMLLNDKSSYQEIASENSGEIPDFPRIRSFVVEETKTSCLQGFEWTFIRVVLSVLDILLLTHRITNLFVVLRKFRADGRQLPLSETASSNCFVLQLSNINHINVGKKDSGVRNDGTVLNDLKFTRDGSKDGRYIWRRVKPHLIESDVYSCAVGQNSEQIYCQLGYKNCAVPESTDPRSSVDEKCRPWLSIVCFWVRRLHHTNGFPRLFTASVVVLLLCFVERLASRLARQNLPLVFVFFLWSKSKWTELAKSVEWDLSTENENGGPSISTLYYKDMMSQLSQLERAVKYFQHGFKEGLLSLCFQARSYAPNVTCIVPNHILGHFDWKIPMTPCNFLPVHLQATLSDWFMKPLNYLIEMFALTIDCFTAVTYTSLNVTAAFLAAVMALRLVENLTVHCFRARRFVPNDISKHDVTESEDECISRPLSTEVSQCFSNDVKIQHVNDLFEKTGQTTSLSKEACASCHNERLTSFPTNYFSGSDV